MKRPSRWEREASRATRQVTRRAIRRLDVLEWVMMAAAAGVAVGGGALVAAVLVGSSSPAFRTVWVVLSVALFATAGAIVFVRRRREERTEQARAKEASTEEDRESDDG